jgi:hypothetical protein
VKLPGFRKHLSYANVVASIALFVALGGGAYAATQLPKNSVGTKQLKKNAVTGKKLKKNAVTGKKVKNRSLSGADISVRNFPKVPRAGTADTAATAGAADTAATATNLVPPEAWREVGAPGQPGFKPGASNAISPLPGTLDFETAAFYKDREGVVHLKGMVVSSSDPNHEIFNLPAGYRPGERRLIEFAASCRAACAGTTTVQIIGSGFGAADDGKVMAPNDGPVSLDGITFRAGS